MITPGGIFFNKAITWGVHEIIAPSANTKGLIIRTCTASGGGSTSFSQLTLFADTFAPSGFDEGSRRIVFLFVLSPFLSQSYTLPYELNIPAGLGLWMATAGTMSLNLTYDLLHVKIER